MRNRLQPALWLIVLCCLALSDLNAAPAGVSTGQPPSVVSPVPTPTPAPPLNQMKINRCEVENLPGVIADETRRGLVIDARPFAINQATGKMSFTGKTGRVTVLNLNPFVYKYRITVVQDEQVTTAVTDFLKLILPQSLGSVVGLQSGTANQSDARVTAKNQLTLIAQRLEAMKPDCRINPDQNNPSCLAINAMYEVFKLISESGLIKKGGAEEALAILAPGKDGGPSFSINPEFVKYTALISELRDEEAEARQVCDKTTNLYKFLGDLKDELAAYFKSLDLAQKSISEITELAKDLEELATAYDNDNGLKTEIFRCKGFKCIDQFKAYAQKVREVLGAYTTELNALREKADKMRNTYLFLEQIKDKEGLFARTFFIIRKFELSNATVTVARDDRLEQRQGANPGAGGNQSGGQSGNQSGTQNPDANRTPPQPIDLGGESTEGTGPPSSNVSNFAPRGNESGIAPTTDALPAASEKDKDNKPATSGQIKEVVQVGRPRTMLSGGLVYSPLPRRTFVRAKGFALDAQGNPTGSGNADVVGLDENSPRRLLPMVLLNSRLLTSEPVSLFFSLGVSAKHDGNVDLEYLLGPSIGILNDRALITFGAYGGKTQKLVDDLRVGDVLPNTLGNASLYRKGSTWKPGFSFSYSFSRPPGGGKAAGGGAGPITTSATAERRNEIRIGSIPFNLALGLVYTTLEERTYDEIVGFARDRQGNLTNGRTLARIVGLSSSSNYRLTPLALLHTRLTNFGNYDFYFSSGVTGKKTDNNFDIEYLLGGSFNLYGRKVFLTFGAFAGKQQILGSEFFEGASLDSSQNVTIQNRYVWKPAFAISYDVSRIVPRPR